MLKTSPALCSSRHARRQISNAWGVEPPGGRTGRAATSSAAFSGAIRFVTVARRVAMVARSRRARFVAARQNPTSLRFNPKKEGGPRIGPPASTPIPLGFVNQLRSVRHCLKWGEPRKSWGCRLHLWTDRTVEAGRGNPSSRDTAFQEFGLGALF